MLKKIKFILFLFLIILFSFATLSFGSTTNSITLDNNVIISVTGSTISSATLYDYAIFYKELSTNTYTLFTSDTPFILRPAEVDELYNGNYYAYYFEFETSPVAFRYTYPSDVSYSEINKTYSITTSSGSANSSFANNILYFNLKGYEGEQSDLTTNNFVVLASNIDYSLIYEIQDDITYPYITNSKNLLALGNFDYLSINCGDFQGANFREFFLLVYDYTDEESNYGLYPITTITFSDGLGNKYYTNTYDGSYIYMIPISDLGVDFIEGNTYCFKLAVEDTIFDDETQTEYTTYNYFSTTSFVIGATYEEDEESDADIISNKLDEQAEILEAQTDAIKEQTETSKSILQTIIDLPSTIINLLLDCLKSLFIPEDGFFSEWFSDLNDTFSEQFGIIYYPIDLSISFLTTLNDNLTDHDPIISTPEFTLSFMGFSANLLPAFEYNFNDLLANDTFNTIHSFYLLFVDVIFTLGLIRFCSKLRIEIFGGVDDNDTYSKPSKSTESEENQ